jgi:hypothetical protein
MSLTNSRRANGGFWGAARDMATSIGTFSETKASWMAVQLEMQRNA